MDTVKTIIDGHEMEVPGRLMPAPKIMDETELLRTVVICQRAYEVPLDVANALDVRDDLVSTLQWIIEKGDFTEPESMKQVARAALRKAGVTA